MEPLPRQLRRDEQVAQVTTLGPSRGPPLGVWSFTLGQGVLSKWPDVVGGGSYQRMTGIPGDLCATLIGWPG